MKPKYRLDNLSTEPSKTLKPMLMKDCKVQINEGVNCQRDSDLRLEYDPKRDYKQQTFG